MKEPLDPILHRKHALGRWRLWVILLLTLLLSRQHHASAQSVEANAPDGPFATTITVNTSTDLTSDSVTKTCTFTSGIYVAAGDGCTLRRALLEAAARPQSDRPIAIRFNLAPGDPNANLEVAGTWTLPVDDALPRLKTPSIVNLNGSVTIDGATQPGGRSTGPKVIIDTNDWSLEVESENNVIRNLSFKGGGVIFLKEDGNIVEKIWMGLTDNGQAIAFRTPAQPNRMAGGGIQVLSNNNVVQDNVLSGAFARAVNIDGGDNNTVQNNRIGTRADGSVPTVPPASRCLRSLSLDAQNWYGGWGIALSGSNNQILGNRIAGLHIVQSANDTPPMAIEIFGVGHEVSDNIIGVDATGNRVGVCGQGIKVSGSGTQIMDNTIVRSRIGFEDIIPTAILASDSSPTFGQITVRGNLVDEGPGGVYEFGPGVPSVLRTFNPARITGINGVNITGGAGVSSPCPGCRIDLYRDDNDTLGETLAFLGGVTANAQGNFAFTLAQPLAAGQGLRTSSTPLAAGVIGSFGAGTTTRISKLYLPMSGVSLVGPATAQIGVATKFTITVSPASATAPFDYLVTATDISPLPANGLNATVVVATLTWPLPGEKTVTVNVTNDLGTVNISRKITILDGSPDIYLPLIRK